MQKITGVQAAWMEHDGLGTFSIDGKAVVFKGDGRTARWWCKSNAEAEQQLRLFRAATKYPQTRAA